MFVESLLSSSMGHETVLASLTLFGRQKNSLDEKEFDENELRLDQEYIYVENFDAEKVEGQEQAESDVKNLHVYALLEFEKPVVIAPKSKGTQGHSLMTSHK